MIGVYDDLIERLPEDYRQYVRWCIDDVDLACPYHDALDDGGAAYATDFMDKRVAVRWAILLIAGMPDATYGVTSKMWEQSGVHQGGGL